MTRVERGTGLEPAVFGRLPLGGVAVNHALPFSAPAVDAVGRDAGGLEVAALERVDERDHLGGQEDEGAGDEFVGDAVELCRDAAGHGRNRVAVAAHRDREAHALLETGAEKRGRDGHRAGERRVGRTDVARWDDAGGLVLRLLAGHLLRAAANLLETEREVVPESLRDERLDVGLDGIHFPAPGDALFGEEGRRGDGLGARDAPFAVGDGSGFLRECERLVETLRPLADGGNAHRGTVGGRVGGNARLEEMLEAGAVAGIGESASPLAERVRDTDAVAMEEPLGNSHREDGVVGEGALLGEKLVVRPERVVAGPFVGRAGDVADGGAENATAMVHSVLLLGYISIYRAGGISLQLRNRVWRTKRDTRHTRMAFPCHRAILLYCDTQQYFLKMFGFLKKRFFLCDELRDTKVCYAILYERKNDIYRTDNPYFATIHVNGFSAADAVWPSFAQGFCSL